MLDEPKIDFFKLRLNLKGVPKSLRYQLSYRVSQIPYFWYFSPHSRYENKEFTYILGIGQRKVSLNHVKSYNPFN